MKKIITNLVVFLLLTFNFQISTVFAQSPKMFKYQTVVRNSAGAIIQNQAVAFRISLLQGSATGTAAYSETQSKTTNDFGLVNLEIGNGIVVSGTMNSINWANGPYFIKVELDIANGSNFITMGTSELLSVPYALYAEKAGTTNYTETDPIFAAHPSHGITTTNISNWTTAFGWGNHAGLYRPIGYVPTWSEITGKPTIDTSFTNELQTLGLSNDSLSISGTNKVSLLNYKSKWLSSGNNIYYNNGKVGINNTGSNLARLKVDENLYSDTAIAIDAHTYGGIAIKGKSVSASSADYTNNGVYGEVETSNGTSGKAIRGYAYGTGYAIGAAGEASTSNSNTGVQGIALSRSGNNYMQIGGDFTARGDWNTALGVGIGNHYGVMATAYGGGYINLGVYAIASGKSDSTDNYGGYFIGKNDMQTSGWCTGVKAKADSSTYINRGVEGHAISNVGQWNQGGIFFSEGTGHSTLNTTNVGVYGIARNNRSNNYGVYGISDAGLNPSAFCEGVYGEVYSAKGRSYGVDGTNTSKGKWNVGVGGFAYGAVTADSINIGLYGYVGYADTNYAVYANAQYDGKVNYGIYALAKNGTINNYAGFFDGNVTVKGNLNVTGNISKASGTFKIDHPLDPQNKYLVHSFVESPDMLNVYSGNIVTDNNGIATIKLPDYFSAANTDFRYQLTCIGQFAQVIVKEEIINNQFVIQSSIPDVKISWQVTGVRNDNYAQKNRIVPVQEKPEIEKGTYLHPEAYGKSEKEGTYKTNTISPSKPDLHLSEKERKERMQESIANPKIFIEK